MGDNKISDYKTTRQTLAISIVVRMRQCHAGRITQWSTSWASLETTGCHHQVSACIASLRWPPWLMILVENTKH
jgi:hypothetical protein